MKHHLLWLICFVIFTTNISIAQELTFNNPIAEQRADPWVHKTKNGDYFLIATVPAYDKIVLRQAKSINELKDASEKVIWNKHKKGVMGHHIWAPELHKINGIWYIYFAAGEAENVWNIRMWVLSNNSENPNGGDLERRRTNKNHTRFFFVRCYYFEHQGKRYLIWAQNISKIADGTSLVISEMKNPTTLTGKEIIITNPDFSWEKVKYNVNEGPAVLKKNGKIFVSYSASATNDNYCIGLLWIDENKDLLDANNWNKSPSPVFYSNADVKRYGPGHNSFTTSEDGTKDIMIYHARNYREIKGNELSDPNRATRAREIKWSTTGFPDFMQKQAD